MSPSAHPLPRSARIARSLAVAVLAFGLLATTAVADEKAKAAKVAAPTTPGPQAAEAAVEMSPYELARMLRDRLFAYTAAPHATAAESAVRSAWRVALKPRARRMVRRMDIVSERDRWDVRGQTPDTWAPQGQTTPRVLREVAMLYVELAAARKEMAGARIVEGRATRFGHMRARREREPVREAELSGVRTRVGLDFQRVEVEDPNGNKTKAKSFKVGIQGQTRHVRIRLFDREIEQRLADRRQAAFDAEVGGIRARIDAYTRSLDEDMELLRVLGASLQLAEEMRLADQVSTLEDAGVRRRARALLDQMKVSRFEARRTSFAKASRYGGMLRTGWLQKRAGLLRLLRAARTEEAAG